MLQRVASLLRARPPVIADRGLLWGSGTTVPTGDGWQTGAIFQKTDGGNNNALYVNEGSVTVAAFKAIAGDIGAHGITLSGSTGITLSGSMPTGVDFTGTFTGNGIDFSDATIDPTVAGSNGPCFIRLGTYAAPKDYGANNYQSGVIRLYTTCSGDISSYDRGVFVCTVTTGAKAAFPVAGLAEANNTGTGPKSLQAAQFIAHLGARSSGAHLAPCDNIAGGSTNGMYGVWAKVGAAGTAVCETDSRIAAVWVDNQMSGTVNGQEYGIFATTGCSRPDAFIGFETTSSGYNQLLYFDETFNSSAGVCVTTDAVPGTQDARILVWYDGKQYYLALYR